MLLVICFFLGIGNFALHKAVVESDHPFVRDVKYYFGRHIGKHGSYFFEFIILTMALFLAHGDALWAAIAYALYTVLNLFSAWLFLNNRI